MSAAPVRDQHPGLSTSRALVPFVTVPKAIRSWPLWQVGVLVAGFGLAVGIGGGGTYAARHLIFGHQAAPSTALLHRLEDEVVHLQQSVDGVRVAADASRSDEAIRGLKRGVEGLKQDIEQVRTGTAASVAQLAAKIDKVDHDPSARLSEIAARLERIEKQATAVPPAAPKPVAAVAPLPGPAVVARTVAPTPPAAPAALPPKPLATATTALPSKAVPASAVSLRRPAASLPAASARKPAIAAEPDVTQVSRSTDAALPAPVPALTAWVLRDVYDGVALVEGRDGALREVGPGQYLPGAGQVRSIERHGRNWVVLTSRGVINATF